MTCAKETSQNSQLELEADLSAQMPWARAKDQRFDIPLVKIRKRHRITECFHKIYKKLVLPLGMFAVADSRFKPVGCFFRKRCSVPSLELRAKLPSVLFLGMYSSFQVRELTKYR